AMYRAIAGGGPGAVLELPLGVRDGFGEAGLLDESVLFYQTIHERPIAGGFVARLPPSVRKRYEESPVLAVLVQLSGQSTALGAGPDVAANTPDRETVAEVLPTSAFRHVVVYNLPPP